MDKGETIKFRITGEVFNDTTPIPDNTPGGVKTDPAGTTPQPGSSKAVVPAPPVQSSTGVEGVAIQKIPYSMTVSFILCYYLIFTLSQFLNLSGYALQYPGIY